MFFNSPAKDFDNDQLGTSSGAVVGVSRASGIVLGSSHAVYYKVDKTGKVTKNFMFGKSSEEQSNKFCLFYTS